MRDDSDEWQPLLEDLEGPTPDSQSRHEVTPLIERDQDRSNRHRCPRTHEGWRFLKPLPFSTRRAGQIMLIIFLGCFVAAYMERRAQRNLRTIRQKLIAFLHETKFHVVEMGRVSEAWHFPVRRGRRLSADMGNESAGASVYTDELGARYFRDVASISTPQTIVRTSADKAGNEHGTRHENEARAGILGKPSYSIRSEKSESELNGNDGDMTTYNSGLVKTEKGCPLIFSTDERTAKKHGLTLSEDERKLLGTVTARLCRCLCHLSSSNFAEHREENSWREVMRLPANTTVSSAENKLGSRQIRQRRRLGMCRGQETSSMLEEMVKGANVVIAGDSGWFYEWFASMQDAHRRISSHFSTRSTVGVSEGTVLRAILTGTDMYGDSWFQLEGAGWRPFSRPFEALLHAVNYVQYKLQNKQVGPLGKSTHTDHQPVTVTFDGCLHDEDIRGTMHSSLPAQRLEEHD